MRLPLPTHGAQWRRALRLACATVAPLLLAPAAARATHYDVNATGGGGFTTIQAAVNADAAAPRDSIVIAPGTYPETVVVPVGALNSILSIVGSTGAAVTTLHAIVPAGRGSFPRACQLSGLTFDQAFGWGPLAEDVTVSRCVFQAGFDDETTLGAPANAADCDFRHDVIITGWSGEFRGLHLAGATLAVATGAAGDLRFRDCTFEGPADALVTARGSADNSVVFDHCVFADATSGIRPLPVSNSAGLFLESCRFHDLATGGIVFQAPPGVVPFEFGYFFRIRHSRFDRCGTAVRWDEPFEGFASDMVADSVYASTLDALVVPGARYDSLVVEGAGGSGMRVNRVLAAPERPGTAPMGVMGMQLRHSRFAGNAGAGVIVSDTLTGSSWRIVNALADCEATGNGGAGFDVQGANWHVGHCLAQDDGGDGLRFTSVESGYADAVDSSTFAGNRGAGLRWSRARGGDIEPQKSEHDLLARNGDAGLVAAAAGPVSVAFNDAWKNRHGDFTGVAEPADSNLSVDPEFCHDALTLEFGSPCGAGGVYGLIGAEPETCGRRGRAPIAGEAPIAAPASGPAVRPNPARGSVEFALPAGAGGSVEVLDVQGRRVWSATLAGGAAARWDGATAAGRARPGLYLARIVQPGGVRIVPFVWTR